MVDIYHKEKANPLLPEENLPKYHGKILCGKTYPNTILWFSVNLLGLILPLTQFLLEDIWVLLYQLDVFTTETWSSVNDSP